MIFVFPGPALGEAEKAIKQQRKTSEKVSPRRRYWKPFQLFAGYAVKIRYSIRASYPHISACPTSGYRSYAEEICSEAQYNPRTTRCPIDKEPKALRLELRQTLSLHIGQKVWHRNALRLGLLDFG